MKKTKITLLFLVVLSQSILAQFELCESSISTDLYDIYFIDENIGIAVGDSGGIVRSIDGGLNWNLVMSNDTVEFKKVRFFDSENLIVIGSEIYVSNNAGLTWIRQDVGNSHFSDIAIINDSTAIVSGYPNKILKTTNQGETWSIVLEDDSIFNIHFMSFLDENMGYSVCTGGKETKSILKTTDGGVSWEEIMTQSGIEYTILETLSFVSEEIGFRGGWYNPHLMRTIDAGINWEKVNFESVLEWEQSILDFHIDKTQPNSYYACGWYSNIFKSEDGGMNWKELESDLEQTISLYGIYFLNDSVGWVVGGEGTILKTINGGIVGTSQVDEWVRIKVFPNPSERILNIEWTGEIVVQEVLIYDNNGRLVRAEQAKGKIDITNLGRGVYSILIKTDNGVYTEKFVK